MEPLASPRFPALAPAAGGYESWYLKAGDPEAGRAVWIRYTVHKRPGQEPEGSVWFTRFDPAAGRPFAVKQTGTAGALTTGPDIFLGVGELGRFTPGRAEGRIAGAGRSAGWQLAIAGGEDLVEHLPARLYGAPLPRTKLLSVTPSTTFSGWFEIDGERVGLDGWTGMIGHNWGSQHAERWVWLHGIGFEGRRPDTWIDLAPGRVRIGPWTTPWVVNGVLSIDGVRHRLGGFRAALGSTRIEAAAGRCHLELPGRDLRLSGTIAAPLEDTVAWRYADPNGSEHHTLNCSIAKLTLTVTPRGGEPFELHTATGAAYEYGSRDTGHGVPLEPFGDG